MKVGGIVMDKKVVKLSGMINESLVNGPGMRRVFFAQGCKHNCKGCFNPETHKFEGGQEVEIEKLINSRSKPTNGFPPLDIV